MPGSVVMVHGLRTSSSLWRAQRVELEQLGYRVLTPTFLAASCGTQPNRVILDAWRVGAAVIHRFKDRGLALNSFMVRRFVRDPELANDVISGGVCLEVMDDALRELRVLNLPRSLAAIDHPVWLVNGTLDHFRLQERRYLRAARDGRLVHVPGATHMVSVTRSQAFTRILVEALAQLP